MIEEDIRKEGKLYLYQQRFGKKWRKVWAEAVGESSHSVARLELFDFSKSSMKESRKRLENKRVIVLRECVQITECESDNCKRECAAFTLQTADKAYTFSCPQEELQSWISELCNLAFPQNRVKSSSEGELHHTLEMKENSLYEATVSVRDFPVVVVKTDAAIRCKLKGEYILTPQSDRLVLKKHKTSQVLFSWPYHLVRKFGQDMLCFNFEAGRRCESGEGYFEFATSQGDRIFTIINDAIANLPHKDAPGPRAMDKDPPESKGHPKKKLATSYSLNSINFATGSPAKDNVKNIKSSLVSQSGDSVYAIVTKEKTNKTNKKQQLPDFLYPTYDEDQLDEPMARLTVHQSHEPDMVYSEVKNFDGYTGKEELVDDVEDLDYFYEPYEADTHFTGSQAQRFSGDQHLHDFFIPSEDVPVRNERSMERLPIHHASTNYGSDPLYEELKNDTFLLSNEESVDNVEDLDYFYPPYEPDLPSTSEDSQAGQFATYDNVMNRTNRH